MSRVARGAERGNDASVLQAARRAGGTRDAVPGAAGARAAAARRGAAAAPARRARAPGPLLALRGLQAAARAAPQGHPARQYLQAARSLVLCVRHSGVGAERCRVANNKTTQHL